MTTNTTEKGLESLICTYLTEQPSGGAKPLTVRERPAEYGVGWSHGDSHDYDREYCVDIVQLSEFLHTTQPQVAAALNLSDDNITRRKFLARLQGEITKRGTTAVLRNGIKHGPHQIDLFYGAPSPGNDSAKSLYGLNRFTVTRQLRYSNDNAQLALDLGLFINGLPIITFELKNSLTKQTVDDAINQYKDTRNPRERLFEMGRCLAHFAVDDHEVWFCTHLQGKQSWFLPFNLGHNDGRGNPPNPNGLKTDYLWKRVLTRDSLTGIIENYAQIVEKEDPKTKKKERSQIWPRYHQLDVTRKLLSHVGEQGVGIRYLIQHSAGSGKSNSIAWLAHQLIGLEKDGMPVLDTVMIITDRRNLDRQIRNTIRQFAQVSSTVGHAETSAGLSKLIQEGKKIIISTVQKFPVIVDSIGNEHRDRRFAIIIDEAHSGQGGRTTAIMSTALSKAGAEQEEETTEDKINQWMASRKMLSNASYFAFTATPKNRTLEIFGDAVPDGGKVRHVPFHLYSMKQAIQEGFILDVLANYTQIDSYYRLIKTIEDDPEFDSRRAQRKLRRYVENHETAIALKAEIMVDHFHDQVIGKRKIGGQARAMVVTDSVQRAIQYYHAIRDYLTERKSPFRAIVAFAGEHEYGGANVTEASLNGFPSNQIEDKIKEEPYRLLVCAEKFQTGYDEPLLHTMYVDKTLTGIKAVQTLSRLNRARPQKHDTFVLDFANQADNIQKDFADYYRTTILAEETDPDRLNDLQSDLDGAQVYDSEQVDALVEKFFDGADRDQLDPVLDACVATYREELEEDGQVDFKGKAKGFLRTYGFLSAILPYNNAGWEKLSIFLTLLVPKLPAPVEDDLSQGILEAIDMDSYRLEKQAVQSLLLPDENAVIEPVPTAVGGRKAEPELERLSSIIQQFNDLFGDYPWEDKDKILQVVTEEIPTKVVANQAYQNAVTFSDLQNARVEHGKALQAAVTSFVTTYTTLFKEFNDNPEFHNWLSNTNFAATYEQLVNSAGSPSD